MKKVYLICTLFCLSAYICFSQIEPLDSDGNGYRNVSTLDHLRWISENVSSWTWNYELDNDINAFDTKNWNSGAGWSPIGNNNIKFKGKFKGNNHSVDNLYILRPSASFIGFIGYAQNVEISNIKIENCSITGYDFVGALVGYNYNISIISNCYSTGSVIGNLSVGGLVGENYLKSTVINCFSTVSTKGLGYVGGLLGYNNGSSIVSNCHANGNVTGIGSGTTSIGGLVGINNNSSTISNSYCTGNISGFIYIGGLVGFNFTGTISNSYCTGNITGTRYSGGFVGYNYSSTIEKCYSLGNVIANAGSDFIGGFVGCNHYNSNILNSYSRGNVIENPTYYSGGFAGANVTSSNITNCYSTGIVTGVYDVGGLVGFNNTNVTNSFWDIQTSGRVFSAGGIGKNSSEMKTQNTFENAGWNFNTIWGIQADENDGYPYLIWQFVSIHYIPLSAGWNIISTYLEPENTSIPVVWNDVKQNVVIVKNNEGGSYIPAFDIDDIKNWKIGEGYQVYFSHADTLVVTGLQIVPELTPITLNAGWNIISYLRNSELDCETAFASITDNGNLIIVKDNFGNTYIPAYNINSIGNLIPGQGYQIYVLNIDELVYPEN